MTSFKLKIIAIITMLIDHSSYLFNNIFLKYIGRIGYPIFAFQTSISYQKTKNIKKHILRLLIFSVISEIPYYLFFGRFLNIFFTLLLGIICLIIYDKITEKSLSLAIIFIISILARLIGFDYGLYGIWLIVLFYIFRNKKIWMNISVISFMTSYHFVRLLLYETTFSKEMMYLLFSLSSLILINMYNGKEGKKTGYLLYIIYPLHLLIFYIIKRML